MNEFKHQNAPPKTFAETSRGKDYNMYRHNLNRGDGNSGGGNTKGGDKDNEGLK